VRLGEVVLAFAFDTLGYSKRLRDAGVAEEQAEAQAEAARDFIMTELVIKADLYAVRSDLKADLTALKADVKADLSALKADVKSDLQAFKADLLVTRNELQASIDKSALQVTVRFGGIVAVGVGILAALQRMH
jgi:hypothetical protein